MTQEAKSQQTLQLDSTTQNGLTMVSGIIAPDGHDDENTQITGAFAVSYEEVDYDDSFTGKNIKGSYSVVYGADSLSSTGGPSSGSSPFASTPTVVCTANRDDGDTHTRICTLLNSDKDGFVVYVVNINNDDQNDSFINFVAIGPAESS